MTRRVVYAALAASMAHPLSAQAPAADWWRHVQVLSHDSLRGRDTGSPGHEQAAKYVADEFRRVGLTPGGTTGWQQRVDFVESRLTVASAVLQLGDTGAWSPLELGRDLRVAPQLSTGDVDAPLVFVGYGLAFPEAGLNDLANLDVRGKIVVHVAGVPRGLSAPMQAHASRSRWAALRQAGVLGVVSIGPGAPWNGAAPWVSGATMSLADTSLDDTRGQRINATANPALGPRLLAGSGVVWDSVVAQAKRGDPLPRALLRTRLRAVLPTTRRSMSSPNVVGVLPGTDPALRDEVVVLTAHLDHVGVGIPATPGGDSIFNGAMDNASGAATLIETAKRVRRSGKNRRTVAFVAVTAEEKGLLGSRYFAAHPSLGAGKVVANLNTDMFLPLIPLTGVFAYGYDESDLADDLDAVTKARGLAVMPDPEPQENRFVRSDQYSFIRQGIPALAFKVGYRPGTPEEATWTSWVRTHYHKVSDDVTQPVVFSAADGFNAMYADLALRVANRDRQPQWRPKSFFATPIGGQ